MCQNQQMNQGALHSQNLYGAEYARVLVNGVIYTVPYTVSNLSN